MIDDPGLLATVMFKMANRLDQNLERGALRAYNPGLLPMFLASPFDKLHAVAGKSPWPARLMSFYSRCRPTSTLRARAFKNMAKPDMSGMPVKARLARILSAAWTPD